MLGDNDIFNSSWRELVFTGKNKEYGAYVNRQKYFRNVNIAIASSVFLFGLAIAAPMIINKIKEAIGEDRSVQTEAQSVKLNTPPPPPPPPPPPADEPPPPKQDVVQYTPPVIAEDNEVTDENALKPPDKPDVVIGSQNIEGRDDGVDYNMLDRVGNDVSNMTGSDDDGGGGPLIYVENMPEFPGGEEKMIEWLQSHVSYPSTARDAGWQGVVYIKITITPTGDVRDVKVERSSGFPVLDEAAKEGVSKMPKWKPGNNGGQAVSVYSTIPVNFNLSGGN